VNQQRPADAQDLAGIGQLDDPPDAEPDVRRCGPLPLLTALTSAVTWPEPPLLAAVSRHPGVLIVALVFFAEAKHT